MIGMLGVNLEPLWDICHRAPENLIIIIFKEVDTVVEFFLFHISFWSLSDFYVQFPLKQNCHGR